MDNYPVQLFFKWPTKLFSIFPDPINANENISFDITFVFRIIESDDIGEGIVVKVFPVELVQIIVRAKNIVDALVNEAFIIKDILYPVSRRGFIVEGKINILIKKINRHSSGVYSM